MAKTKSTIINGVEFTWHITHRGSTGVTVDNPLYGRAERRLDIGMSQEDLVQHLAIELLWRGPRFVERGPSRIH